MNRKNSAGRRLSPLPAPVKPIGLLTRGQYQAEREVGSNQRLAHALDVVRDLVRVRVADQTRCRGRVGRKRGTVLEVARDGAVERILEVGTLRRQQQADLRRG